MPRSHHAPIRQFCRASGVTNSNRNSRSNRAICLAPPTVDRGRITKQSPVCFPVSVYRQTRTGARFTKYLTTILRLSYDNAKVTTDSRRTSNLQNILQKSQGFSWVRLTCKIVRSSEIMFVNKLVIFLKEISVRCKSLS